MRAYVVVLALLATTLALGVSQTGSGLPGRSSCLNGQGTQQRSAQGTANAHKGLCAAQDPPPQRIEGPLPAQSVHNAAGHPAEPSQELSHRSPHRSEGLGARLPRDAQQGNEPPDQGQRCFLYPS